MLLASRHLGRTPPCPARPAVPQSMAPHAAAAEQLPEQGPAVPPWAKLLSSGAQAGNVQVRRAGSWKLPETTRNCL